MAHQHPNDGAMISIFDFLFPRSSLTGHEGEWITASELRRLHAAPVILEKTQLLSLGWTHIDRIVAAADYKSVPMMRKAVQSLKYKRVRGVAEILGGMLSDVSHLLMPSPNPLPLRQERAPVLCPVPLHWIRKFSRGFNQAELLAKEISKRRGWMISHLLVRNRWTGSQVGRKREERKRGVRDAFCMRKSRDVPSRVLLIDDVATTGATMDACAKALKSGGVDRVEGFVLAMG